MISNSGRSASLYLKTQIKSQQYVRQKIMKIVVIFSSLLNPIQLIPLFYCPCPMTKDISESNPLQEAHEVFVTVCMTCPAKWVPWSLEIVESTLTIFFYSEILILKPGKALSNKNEVCQGAGKIQVAVLDFPKPWLYDLQLLFTHF